MERVLCIVSAMNTGGAETFLMKIYRQIDKSKYQIDFCVNTAANYYGEEIERMGGEIFIVPLKSKHPIMSFKAISKLIMKEGYSGVMRVSQHSLAVLDLIAARRGGATKLIMRSSNANSGTMLLNILHKAFRFLPRAVPSVKIAPSLKAAEYTFGRSISKKNNFYLIKNGLDIERYAFNEKKRKGIRSSYGWEGRYVIGHIGRFEPQKNHRFLLSVFEKIYQEDKDAVLVLIGSGKLWEEIKTEAEKKGIMDRVSFLGIQDDVPGFLSAFDCFVLPSLYEGMPNTAIEAQTSGLKCYVSDMVTEEVKVTDLVALLSIEKVDEWVEEIRSHSTVHDRKIYAELMASEGYDIKDCTKKFVHAVWGAGENST